jgi:nitronate monooxygenase
MRNFELWTCGHYTYRLKDTSRQDASGKYELLTAEHIFHDYQFSVDNKIALPTAPPA